MKKTKKIGPIFEDKIGFDGGGDKFAKKKW